MDAFITCENISYTIKKNATLRVGRALDCDIRLMQDQRVSRQHCLITNADDVVTIADVGSKHGTTVNAVAVTSHPRVLQNGDVIVIGETRLVFHQFYAEDPGDETVSTRR